MPFELNELELLIVRQVCADFYAFMEKSVGGQVFTHYALETGSETIVYLIAENGDWYLFTYSPPAVFGFRNVQPGSDSRFKDLLFGCSAL